MAIDFSRLRRQNLFPETPDITQGGIMGDIDFSGVGQEYDMGGINLPPPEEPFGGNYRVQDDPRSYVNPAIAPPVGGPGSKGQMTAEELMKFIDSIYTPETTSRDRFNRLLDSAPEREEPSAARRLVASAMGFGQPPKDSLGTMEGVMYAPHARAMQDWTAKTGPFGNAAQYENTANVNERNLAGTVATNIVNQNRYEQQNEIAQQKAESERIRSQAYYMKNAGWDFNFSGPEIIATHPSGQRMNLGPTGKLSDTDKINLQGQWGIKAAEARGAAALNVANATQTGQTNRTNLQGWSTYVDERGNLYFTNPRTMEQVPGPGSPETPVGRTVPFTPTTPRAATPANTAKSQNDERNLKFIELANDHPEYVGKYILQPATPSGNWMMGRPPEPRGIPGFKKIDPEEMRIYNEIRVHMGFSPLPSAEPTVSQQITPDVPPPAGSNKGIGPRTVPPLPADQTTTAPEYVDPFAQPTNQGFGGTLSGIRESLRPPAVVGAPIEQGPTGQSGIPNEPPPPPINVPPDAPFTLEQIQNMPYAEIRQRAIGYLMRNNIPTTEENIQIAIQNGRLAK